MLYFIHKIQQNLVNILNQFHFPNGQSVGILTGLDSESHDDESSITRFTISVNYDGTENTDEFLAWGLFNDAMRDINPNELLKLDEETNPLGFEKTLSDNFLTIWRTPNADTFIIQETDATFYIIIINSGQY